MKDKITLSSCLLIRSSLRTSGGGGKQKYNCMFRRSMCLHPRATEIHSWALESHRQSFE